MTESFTGIWGAKGGGVEAFKGLPSSAGIRLFGRLLRRIGAIALSMLAFLSILRAVYGSPAVARTQGVVVEATSEGEPLEGVSLLATDVSPGTGGVRWSARTVTSASGEYVFAGIPERALSIAIESEESGGYAASRPIYVSPGDTGTRMRLRPSGDEILGSLDLSEIGSALAGRRLRVRASWHYDSPGDLGTVATIIEPDGRFHLLGVPLGVQAYVGLDIGDSARPGCVSTVVSALAGDKQVRLKALRGKAISGRVPPAASGTPRSAYLVNLYLAGGAGSLLRMPIRSAVALDGEPFRLEDLPDALCDVEVMAKSSAAASAPTPLLLGSVSGVRAGTDLGDIVLDRGPFRRLQVTVHGPVDSEFVLEAWRHGGLVSVLEHNVCGSQGIWHGSIVIPSKLDGCTLVAASGSDMVGAVRAGVQESDWTIQLARKKCVSGRIVGSEPSYALVQVEVGDWRLGTTYIHVDGSFHVCGLPDGRCDVVAFVRRPLSKVTGVPSRSGDLEMVGSLRSIKVGATGVEVKLDPR
jgi:hypothetical protein